MTRLGTVMEPARTLPVDSACDVAVVGGGIAGVAAALAAARQGVRVVLIEKQFGLGGLATLGNVIKYLPLCDGHGRKVMGGIAEELLLRSVAELREPAPAAGFVPLPACWEPEGDEAARERTRLRVSFNPHAFQLEMERLIEEAGVALMYDTRVCNVLRDDTGIAHLIVENKSGRLAIAATAFVDASGDADVAFLAGCPVEEFPFNVPACWHYEWRAEGLRVVTLSKVFDKEHRGGNGAVGPFYSGTDHRDVTRHVLDSRRLARERLARKRGESPEESIHLFGLASIPDLRITRRLRNPFSLGEIHRHCWLEDAVGVIGDWRRRGPVYPIPLRAIQAAACPNLFVTGRCLSADHTVIDVTRAIGACAVTGEAGGTAAALIARDRLAAERFPVDRLQDTLRKAGMLIHPDLVKPHPRMREEGE